MARKELTTKAVENAKPPAAGKLEMWDSRVPGFGLRVGKSGAKTFQVMVRINGKQVRKRLGNWPGMDLSDARKLAGEVKDAAREGRDLMAERQAETDAAQAELAGRKTFGEVAEDYIKREVSRLRRGGDIENVIRRELADWFPRPVVEITPHDVIEVTDSLLDAGKPAAANKAFEVIRRIFNWAIKRRIYGLDRSPADRMDPPAEKVIRDRTLSEAEIKTFWQACDKMDYPYRDFLRLLLLLGQRRDEVAGMQWREIGEDDEGKPIWTIPVERCKSKRPHIVPLPPQAVELLDALPRFAGPYVFSTTGGRRPISGYSKAKARFEGLVKINEPWTLHDLRRTMWTGLARLGIVEIAAERAINHAPRGLSRIYDQWEYLPEKRHALNVWADWLASVTRPDPEKVVRLRHG